MYHLHTLGHMSYVYLYISFSSQGNTSTIEVIFLHSGCGRVVQGAGHKTKRLVLQCINGVSSNPVEGRTTKFQLKDLILTPLCKIFRRIYKNILYTYCTCSYFCVYLVSPSNPHVFIFATVYNRPQPKTFYTLSCLEYGHYVSSKGSNDQILYAVN